MQHPAYPYAYPAPPQPQAPPQTTRVKAVGTKLEVWNGVALRTPGNLTRENLTVKQLPNGGFKVISIAKQKSARERYAMEKAGRGKGLFSLDAKRKGGKTLREHEENKQNGIAVRPHRSTPTPQRSRTQHTTTVPPPQPWPYQQPQQAAQDLQPWPHHQNQPQTHSARRRRETPHHATRAHAHATTKTPTKNRQRHRTPTTPSPHSQSIRTYPPALPEQVRPLVR